LAQPRIHTGLQSSRRISGPQKLYIDSEIDKDINIEAPSDTALECLGNVAKV